MSKLEFDELYGSRLETINNCIACLKTSKIKIGNFELTNKTRVLIDGEIRDRAVWTADIFAAGPFVEKFVKNGKAIWRDSLLAISSRQYKSGKIPACVSLSLKYRFLSTYSDTYGMWWIISASEYIEKTGDKEFEMHFIKVLTNANRYFLQQVNSNYLYKTAPISFDSNWTIFRPRVNVLANALFYQVSKISEKYGILKDFNLNKFKENFNKKFWNNEKGLYMDGEVSFLDANSLAIYFELVDKNNLGKLFKYLKKFETNLGPKSYLGTPKSFTNFHKNLISPFMAYLYYLALKNTGQAKKANEVAINTMFYGLELAKQFNKKTLPEYWAVDGTLGRKAVVNSRFKFGLSLCHAWSTFGDFE